MRIKVTQDHIDRGWRHSFAWCPIGKAMLEMAGVHDVSVGQNCILWLTADDGPCRADTPADVKQFICDFDNKEKVDPFEFDLEPIRVKSVGK